MVTWANQATNQPTNGIDECKGRVEASIKQPVHPSTRPTVRIPLNGWLSAKAGSGIRLDSRGRLRRRLPRKQLFLGAIQKLCITLKVVFAEMRSAPLYSVFSSFYARDIELFKCRTRVVQETGTAAEEDWVWDEQEKKNAAHFYSRHS